MPFLTIALSKRNLSKRFFRSVNTSQGIKRIPLTVRKGLRSTQADRFTESFLLFNRNASVKCL
jgi:ABC-type phosphate/phosphonate transport system substrate-binding protein